MKKKLLLIFAVIIIPVSVYGFGLLSSGGSGGGGGGGGITVSTVYTGSVAEGTSSASTWTVTGISVPSDATACILLFMGYTDGIGTVDISNFDGDSDDHFTEIETANDGDDTNVGAFYLKYGETGFPTRGATGQTLTGSFSNNVISYGAVRTIVFFVSGSVTDGTFLVDTDFSSDASSNWAATLTTGASDLAVIAVENYDSSVSVPATQTSIDTGSDDPSYWGASYEIGETGPSMTFTASYAGGVAFAIKAE